MNQNIRELEEDESHYQRVWAEVVAQEEYDLMVKIMYEETKENK